MTTGGCGRPRSSSGCTDERGVNGDPFDRGLVSQAILNGVTLVTPDAAIALYPAPILW